MTTATITQALPAEIRRSRITGVVLLAIGLAIFLLFGLGLEGGLTTKFGMNPGVGSQALRIPDVTVPTAATIYLLSAVSVFLGAVQVARGFKRAGVVIGLVATFFVIAFLAWAARGKSFNLVGILSSSVVRATPIALAALCGVMSERAGVVNIGIEGMMLMASQAAVVSASLTANLWIGLVAAILTGALLAAVHAYLAIRFKVDQIISGVAINIFATGATSYISSRFLERNVDLLNNPGIFKPIAIPLLSKLPILGPIFFENTIIVYLMMILVAILHVVLFYTPWGLRTRAVGEHPKAADTLGVNVFKVRYVNVILGGAIAGIGGAYFTIGSAGRFDEVMTAGKGFIGLAAMIFGKWTPIGSFLASLLFGFADSLQVKLQILRVPIPSEFLLMAPYIVTMIVLAGIVGRASAPAADGTPYEKN
ncbi:MAG: Branched-chain amino acid transport system / permease component [Chloroflexi bacterium ADurb.Bin325]|nr:MAG: Branched-chain amino acid transport system / permease component [Chloroflexi bacterium ADurb.Bin325]